MSATAITTKPFTSVGELKKLLIDLLPNQGNWSEDEYLWLTDRTNRYVEFTDGFIEVLPMPTDRHQSIVLFLTFALSAYISPKGGKVLCSPLRMRIRARKYREPDIILLKSAHDPRRENRYWKGADLTVEVVSPDKPARDLVDKPADYAEAGVPEYWIVNPQTETITVLKLEGKAYVEHGVFTRGATATSALLSGFAVSVDAAMDAD